MLSPTASHCGRFSVLPRCCALHGCCCPRGSAPCSLSISLQLSPQSPVIFCQLVQPFPIFVHNTTTPADCSIYSRALFTTDFLNMYSMSLHTLNDISPRIKWSRLCPFWQTASALADQSSVLSRCTSRYLQDCTSSMSTPSMLTGQSSFSYVK